MLWETLTKVTMINFSTVILCILIGLSYGYHNRKIAHNNTNRAFKHFSNHIHSIKKAVYDDANISSSVIKFLYYKNGENTFQEYGLKSEHLENTGCNANDKFSFILHGWRQNCETEWVLELIDRLTYYRGGCVICVDYGAFSKSSYMWLYRNYNFIRQVITEKLLLMAEGGFDPSKGFIFGFSFGGQLAIDIGRNLRPKYLIKKIDTCDMAGPGFDLLSEVDHRDSAYNVQCWHSSRDKGTGVYACHQNIRLGHCGIYQPAAVTQPNYSSHGLCVQIYINAFDYPFYALHKKPDECVSKNPARIPIGYRVGFNENPKKYILGEIFVPTSTNFPYNFSKKELYSWVI